MRAQATLEFMMMFLVTMIAILMIFQPIAAAHRDFSGQSELIKKKQGLEDWLVGMQIYCNSGGKTVALAPSASGCAVLMEYGRVKLRCGQNEQEFPGFFRGCVMQNAKEPV